VGRKPTKPKGPPAKPRAGANVRFLRDDDPRVKVRRCLMCGNDFWSAHAGSRRCAKCSEQVALLGLTPD
jgi:hypothetical protein